MFTEEEKIFLARSKGFQNILDKDEILKGLERMKVNRRKECFALAELARGCAHSLSGTPVSGILTPALWVFLWTLENTYTSDPEKITQEDTGIFLYLLDRGRSDLSDSQIAQLPERSETFCREKNVDYPEAAALLIRMVHDTFQMLEILPFHGNGMQEEPVFDLYWLTALCSIAADETGLPLTQIMFRMPLSLCFYCFINHLKKHDPCGTIRRKNDTDSVKLIMDRVRFLGRQYLDSAGGTELKSAGIYHKTTTGSSLSRFPEKGNDPT